MYHNYAIIKIDSYSSLPIEKTLTFHDVIILITKNVLISYLKITIVIKFLYTSEMLCYDIIEVSKRIDVNKTRKSKECDIFH